MYGSLKKKKNDGLDPYLRMWKVMYHLLFAEGEADNRKAYSYDCNKKSLYVYPRPYLH